MGTKALSDYMIEGALHTGSVGHSIGDLKFNERYIPISARHPWKNLADIDEELSEANYPDYVPVMRDVKMFRNILLVPGAHDHVYISNEVISSNTVTLTLNNYNNNTGLINQLAEMLLDYTKGVAPTPTDYANFKLCIVLVDAIGSVPAGDYTITNINPSAKTISFEYVHANESNVIDPPLRTTINPYRVPGDTTKCRHRQQLGKAIMTPDFGTFFNGVSWRDHFQGHWHGHSLGAFGTGTLERLVASPSLNNFWGSNNNYITSPITDGTNGDPRTDSETYSSGLGAFLYRYVGRYVAP